MTEGSRREPASGGFQDLVVTEHGAVTEITLNRPERRNALSVRLMTELTDALRAAVGRVVVLTGAGPSFSAGHDLAEMRGQDVAFYQRVFEVCTLLMDTVQSIPQPVIAKVRGVATAAGCQLVASCDLAVAETGARFATPGVKIGLFCSTPMVPLSRAIGRKRAMEMLLGGELIDAATAAEWGLVNRVVPDERIDDEVTDWAERIAGASPLVLQLGKRTFYRQVDLGQRQAYDLAQSAMTVNAIAADAQEGIDAFLHKRAPEWEGR